MGKLKVAITFDTTGSMYACLREVRTKAQKLVESLFNQTNNVEIAVIAHGDYCDEDIYITKQLDFSNNIDEICSFINNVEATYGGDVDECYSLVLHKLSEMNWDDSDFRIAIVIGDANPHKKGYTYGMFTEQYDWLEETNKLKELGIKIYGVHALANYRLSSKKFYNTISDITDGSYVTLNNLSDIIEVVTAASLFTSDNDAYNGFIENLQKKRITRTLAESIKGIDKNFVHSLILSENESLEVNRKGFKTKETKRKSSSKGGKKKSDIGFSGVKSIITKDQIDISKLEPVTPGKYQYITVEKDSNNKEVFSDFGPKFKTGLIYYELTKTEEVSPKKHVIIRDNSTGDLFSGDDARVMIGLRPFNPNDSTKDKIKASDLGDFTVYIQSTSVNRKHKAGSTLLFELSDLMEIYESKEH